MTKVPVARRRYDITPAEMLDLARSAVDAVVAELQARTEELLPDQLQRLEQVSASLATTVREVAETSYRSQMDTVRAGLDAVRDDISAGLAAHDARLVQAVENRLAGYDPDELGRRLPPAVASAVLDGLEHSLPTIDKGLHELRELVGELVERGKRSELSRQSSLDRLDEVLVELRAGLAESVTRQHGVLLEVLDQKLSELQLTELASTLPGRIGSVISEAVQRSHDLQTEAMHELAAGLGHSLEAGLHRQGSATAELSATAERMADSVTGFSQVAEDAVTVAFERAQAAQAQRLNTMMGDLREAQQEVAVELRSALEAAVRDLRANQEQQVVELSEVLERRIGDRIESAIAPQYEALNEATGRLTTAVSQQTEVAAQQAEAVARQSEGVAAGMQGLAQEVERLKEEAAARGSAHDLALASAVEQFDRIGVHLETRTAAQHEAVAEALDDLATRVEFQGSTDRKALAGTIEQLAGRIESESAANRQELAESVGGLASRLEAETAANRQEIAESFEALASRLAAQAAASRQEIGETLGGFASRFEVESATSRQEISETLGGFASRFEIEAATSRQEVAESVDGLASRLEHQTAATGRQLSESMDRLVERLEARVEAQQELLTTAMGELRSDVESSTTSQEVALTGATARLVDHLSDLMDSLPDRLSTDIVTVLQESRLRQERIESLVAELAWVLGEQRAGATALRDDLAHALQALPEAIASLNEASLRSEARITDLLARKLPGPDAR